MPSVEPLLRFVGRRSTELSLESLTQSCVRNPELGWGRRVVCEVFGAGRRADSDERREDGGESTVRSTKPKRERGSGASMIGGES